MKRTRSSKADATAPKSGTLVVWDFDWSLINENSDTYVLEQLDPAVNDKMEAKLRQGGMGWTQLMDWSVGELAAAGHTPQAIRAALVGVPILSGALSAFHAAKAAGAEQRILSDANTVYISSILEGRGLAADVSTVETNPAAFDDAGRLRIRPHQPAGLPHGCALCPANLCKGAVLDTWLAELAPSRCIYVGDGGGDFCPATRLRASDVLLARQAPHDGLLRKCRVATPQQVRAKVVEWGGDSDGAALHAGIAAALETAPSAPARPDQGVSE